MKKLMIIALGMGLVAGSLVHASDFDKALGDKERNTRLHAWLLNHAIAKSLIADQSNPSYQMALVAADTLEKGADDKTKKAIAFVKTNGIETAGKDAGLRIIKLFYEKTSPKVKDLGVTIITLP